METAPQPEVFLTPQAQNIKPARNWKPFLFFLIGLMTLGGLSFGMKSLIDINPQAKPKIISQGKISDLNLGGSNLFFADLEYNPQTKTVSQLQTGLIKENLPIYSPDKPTIPPSSFVYRVAVISATDGLIQNGWMSVDRKLIETEQKTLKIRVIAIYQPNTVVKVYSQDNILIWTGKIV